MKDARREYEAALADFSRPGERWQTKGRLTYWGKAAGLTAEEIVADARAQGVTDRDADIRRGWADAKPKGDRPPTAAAPCRPVRTKPAASKRRRVRGGIVRKCIDKGRDIDTLEKLRGLSPVAVCADDDPMARLVETQHHLLLLFGRDEFAFIRPGKASAVKATPGENVRTLADWLGEPPGRDLGEVVGVNPVTGREGRTAGGSPSHYCRETVADYRHMVFEFDDMTLPDQCRFWAGAIRREALSLVSLTYSGGKSIHGVVCANAKTAEDFRLIADRLAAIYASPADPPEMRLDAQALKNPLVCVRLAGATRKDTGRRQELLYAARHWRDREYERSLNPEAATGDGANGAAADDAAADDADGAAGGCALAEAVDGAADNCSRARARVCVTEAARDAATPSAAEDTAPAPSTSGDRLARRCDGCAALADCRQAFGEFWVEKSRGGTGCNSSFEGWGAARRHPS